MATRMSAEERRKSILTKAVPLFAKHGFNGTTTKQIAAAAGVSEALLYRYFPSKDSIYAELKDICCKGKDMVTQVIALLKPSTSTLVHTIYYLISVIADGDDSDENEPILHENMHRLLANSYLEDGAFARMFVDENIKVWEPILKDCVAAAIEAGDMIEDWIEPGCRWWFSHHIAVALGFLNLPKEPVIRYGVSRDRLVDQAVRFALRGMGLTDEAIRTHYNPEAMALFSANLGAAQAQNN